MCATTKFFNANVKVINMKFSACTKLTGISMLLVFGLGACNKPGPAESAGEKIDQTVDKAEKKIDDAADKVDKKLNDK